MILAINPAMPEYRATVKLTAVEKPLMRTRHYQKKEALFTGNQVLAMLILWSLLWTGLYVASLYLS